MATEPLASLRVDLLADIGEFQDNLEKARNVLNKNSSFMERRFKRLNKAVNIAAKGIAIGIGAISAATAAVTVSAVKMASDFESSFAGVRKTVDATEEEFAKLEKGIRNLAAREIPIDVNELNKIAESAGQLGIETENIVEFTEVMANLGVTTNLSSEEAATALARLAEITQLPQDQFENLGSAIVSLGNNFATTEAEITNFALKIAGAGNQIGLAESDMLAFGAALSSVGVSAEAGGTAISTVFIEIAKAVDLGGKELEQFAEVAGVSAEQFRKNFKEDAASAIADFIEGLDRIKKEGGSTIRVLEDMGLTEKRLRLALLNLAGAGDLLRNSIENSSEAFRENTALTEEARKRYETTASQVKLLWNRIKDLQITLGSGLLPEVKKIVKAVTDWIDENQDLIEQGLKDFVDAIKTSVQNLGIAFGALTDQESAVKGFFDVFIGAILSANQLLVVFLQGLNAIDKFRIKAKQVDAFFGIENSKQIQALKKDVAEADRAIARMVENNKRLAAGLDNTGKALNRTTSETISHVFATEGAADAVNAALNPFSQFTKEVEKTGKKVKKTKEETDKLTGDTGGGSRGGLRGAGSAARAAKSEIDKLNESLDAQIASVQRQIAVHGLSEKQLIKFEKAEQLAAGGTEERTEKLEELRLKLLQLNEQQEIFIKLARDFDRLGEEEVFESFQVGGFLEGFIEKFDEVPEKAEESFGLMAEFAGAALNDIRRNLEDLVLSGFSDMEDFWESTWKNMLRIAVNILSQIFAQKFILPIQLAISGEGGGGQGQSGGFGDLLGTAGTFAGLGGSFSALGAIGSSLIGAGAAPVGAAALTGGAVAGSSGFISGAGGLLSAFGAALPAIGAVVAAAALAVPLIQKLLKDKPRLNISVGVFDEFEERIGTVATVADFLLAAEDRTTEAAQDLVEILSKSSGVDEGEIRQTVLDIIKTGAIDPISAVISQLPDDIADELQEEFLATEFSLDVKDFLDVRATGKNLQEQLEEGLSGIAGAFIFGTRDIFHEILEAIGVETEKAKAFIESQFEIFEQLEEGERTEFAQQFLAQIDAIVNAANNAASEMVGLAEGIQNIIGVIESLNQKIVQLGGSAVDTSGALTTTIQNLFGMLQESNLGAQQQLALIQQIDQAVGQLIAQQQQAAQAAFQAQQSAIQSQIDAQNQLKNKIQEKFQTELEGLKEVLKVAEQFKQEAESLESALIGLFAGSASPLTPQEQLGFIQAEVAAAKQALATAITSEEELEAIQDIKELSSKLIDLGGTAFGTSSAEFQAIFGQVADELQSLLDTAEAEAEKIDSVQDKIESTNSILESELAQIDASIQASQNKLSSLSVAQVNLQGNIKQILEDSRAIAEKLLQDQIDKLTEVGVDVNSLPILESINVSQLEELQQINETLSGVVGAQHGLFVPPGKNQLVMMHGRQHGEFAIPTDDLRGLIERRPFPNFPAITHGAGDRRQARVGKLDMNINVNMSGEATGGDMRMFAGEIVRRVEDSARNGELRNIIVEVTR